VTRDQLASRTMLFPTGGVGNLQFWPTFRHRRVQHEFGDRRATKHEPGFSTQATRRRHNISWPIGALVIYAAGAGMLTSSVWRSPQTEWIGGCCDAEQTMWYLAWVPYAIRHATNPFFTTQLNAPTGVNLMWNTSTLLPGLVASPVTILFGPVLSYNLLTALGIVLSAWCAFLALRRYTVSLIGPLIGDAVYGFSPYVTSQARFHLDLGLAFVPPSSSF
jgi:hypothetical protein